MQTIGSGDHGVGNQPMTVVGEGVAHVAPSAGVITFAVQLSIGVGAGLVRVKAAAFAFEVAAVTAIVDAVFAQKF
jgi:non-canonical (house-cleaning) NTP pyrophosphatase